MRRAGGQRPPPRCENLNTVFRSTGLRARISFVPTPKMRARRQCVTEHRKENTKQSHLVFVCVSNRGRSVFAEYFMKEIFNEPFRELGDRVKVTSAGFVPQAIKDQTAELQIGFPEPFFGRPMAEATRTFLSERGISGSGGLEIQRTDSRDDGRLYSSHNGHFPAEGRPSSDYTPKRPTRFLPSGRYLCGKSRFYSRILQGSQRTTATGTM